MSKHQSVDREESGKLLQGNVIRFNDRNHQVKSATSNRVYKIYITLSAGFAHVQAKNLEE